MRWNSDIEFPLAGGAWGVWRPPFGRKYNSESAVRRATWQWHPLDPIIVSVPGSAHMLPPICHSKLSLAIQNRMILQYRWLLFLISIMICGCVAIGIHTDDNFFFRFAAALVLFLLFFIFQEIFIFHDINKLREYSRFVAWCHLQRQVFVITMMLFMIMAGVVQYFLQRQEGSLFMTIEKYGLVFDKATIQPWRYFSGPLLHAGPAHWIANFVFLLLSSGLSFALGRRLPLLLLFLSGVFLPGFIMTFLPHSVGLDAFLGISGGVFSLFGWIAGIAFRNRSTFPAGFWWVMAYFSVANGITSTLLDANASWFAHSTGFAMGFVVGAFNLCVRDDILLDRDHMKSA